MKKFFDKEVWFDPIVFERVTDEIDRFSVPELVDLTCRDLADGNKRGGVARVGAVAEALHRLCAITRQLDEEARERCEP